MATFDLRILLETVEGKKTSYMSQSFVDTSVDLVLSASQVYGRITGSVSCSYQNSPVFSGSDFNTNFTFKDNNLLSASLSGSLNTGSIDFTATTSEYDRLLRYKFIGEKVCGVLGLPNSQWIYVDQVRFPADDESNIFQGNIDAQTAFISDTLTFANNANINSDIPFYIDTGSDRYIKFIDTRGSGSTSLIFGYDKETDSYEINASENTTFNIKNLNNLEVDTITASLVSQQTSSTQTTVETEFTNIVTQNVTASGIVSASIVTASGLHSIGNSTFAGDITVGGSVTAQEFITQIISTAEGSNTFGNSIDDIQRFTGSVNITGSVNLPDDVSLKFGNDGDLEIFHRADTYSRIKDNGTGALQLSSNRFKVMNSGNNETMIDATQNAGVDLYFDDSKKLETTNTGINITGDITASNNISSSGNIKANKFQAYGDTGIISNGNTILGNSLSDTHAITGNITASNNISASGVINAFDFQKNGSAVFVDISTNTNLQAGTNLTLDDDTLNIVDAFLKNDENDETSGTITAAGFTTTGTGSFSSLNLSDDGRLNVGASNDLKIFHDSSLGNSVIREDGPGELFIQGSKIRIRNNSDGGTLALFTDGGSSELNFNNSLKLATTDTGINVSGQITASGNISSSGNITAVSMSGDGSQLTGVTGEWDGTLDGDGQITGSLVVTQNITASGNITATGDLDIDGTTNLDVVDIDGAVDMASTLKVTGDITASGEISASGDIRTKRIRFPSPTSTEGHGIIFFDTSSNAPNTKVNSIQWDFTNDDAFIYAHQSSSDGTYFVNELRDNTSTDKFVWWFNDHRGYTYDTFPLAMEGDKFIVNYFYDNRTVFHRDPNNSSDGSRNVDFYLLKSGSSTVSKNNSLIFGDVSNSQVTINGDITASGNISSSGALIGNDLILHNDGGVSAEIQSSTGDSFIRFTDGGSHKFSIGFDNGDSTFAISTGSGLSNNQAITIKSDGKIGIGTITPSKELEVAGDISASGDLFVGDDLSVGNIGSGNGRINVGSIGVLNGESTTLFGVASPGIINIQADNDDNNGGAYDQVRIEAGTTRIMTLSGSGNVGIGTTSPTYALDVTGSLDTTNNGIVRFESNGSGDLVFNKNANGPGEVAIDWGAGGRISAENNNFNIYGFAKDIAFFTSSNATTTITHAAMVITGSSGNVGIGTSNPTAPLNISSSGTEQYQLVIQSTGSGGTGINLVDNSTHGTSAFFYAKNNNVYLGATDNENLLLQTGNSTRMKIDTTGNVGINETNPQEQLHIIGNSRIESSLNGTSYLEFTEVDDPRVKFVVDNSSTPGNLKIQTVNAGGSYADRIEILHQTDDTAVKIYGNITASGNISSSVTSTGSFGHGFFDNKVGIGTNSPYSNLDVQFSRASTDLVSSFGGVAKKGILINNTNGSDGTYANLDFRVDNADARIALEYDNANDGGLHFITDNDNNPGTRMYIASAGNVGIGTTSPSATLHISSSTDPNLILEDPNGSALLRFRRTDEGKNFDLSMQGNDLRFTPNTTDGTMNVLVGVNASSVKVDSRLGIGQPTPSEALDVSGSMNISGPGHITASGDLHLEGTASIGVGDLMFIHADSNNSHIVARNNDFLLRTNRTQDRLKFQPNNTDVMIVSASGNVGIGTSTPTKVLTVEGDISSSGHIFTRGTNFQIEIDGTNGAGPRLHMGNLSDSDNFLTFGAFGDINQIDTKARDFHLYGTNTTTGFYFDESDGKFGIGTTSPLTQLHIQESAVTNFDQDNFANFIIEDDDARMQIVSNDGGNNGSALILTNVSASTHNNWAIGTATSAQNSILHIGYNTSTSDVSAYTAADVVIDKTGKVGIGTTAPTKALQVEGDISASGNLFVSQSIQINGDGGYNDAIIEVDGDTLRLKDKGSVNVIIDSDDAAGAGEFRVRAHSGESTRFIVSSSGNVGIGTTTPDYALDVAGDVGVDKFIYHNGDDNTFLKFQDAGDNIQISAGGSHLNFTQTGLGVGVTATEKLDVDGNIKTTGNVSSPNFFNGFAGSGFRVTSGSKYSLEVDDLTVRNSMSVFELLIHQVRATNGSLFVSNVGKITSASLSSVANHYSMSFDTGSGYGHSFLVGDLVRAQRFVPSTNGSGSQVFKSDLHIISVNGTGSAVGVLTASAGEQHPLSQSAPQPGYEYVRIGSTTTADRQGSIYLTSDDDNAPFIDVVDELTAHSQFNTSGKTKVRMGKLSGITTTTFGTLPGYGFYASGSAFLEGSINATAGEIGGFGITKTEISSSDGSKLRLKSSGQITGSEVLFTGGTIGGFTIDEHSLTTDGVEINKTGETLFISSSEFKVKHDGEMTGSRMLFSSGKIGGFILNNNELSASNFKLNTNTNNETLQLGSVVDFAKDGSDKGMFVSSSGQFFVGAEDGDFIHFTGTALNIKPTNLDITASNIDMTTDTFELNAPDLDISSTQKSMSLGEGKILLQGAANPLIDIGTGSRAIRLFAGSTANFIRVQTSSDPKVNIGDYSDTSKKGIIFGSSAGVPKFGLTTDSNNHFQFDENGLDLKTTTATISGSNVEILTPSFFLGSATNNISSSNNDLSITTKDLTASGSSVEILTPNFFLGTTTNNISSSNNDLSITTKDLTASGSSVNILTPNFFFGSTTNNISSSNDDLSITTKNLTASGSNVSILTDKFFFGSATSNISSSNGNLKIITDDATLSGSSVGISTPSFILGQNGSQFISGSGGNIQIKGTNFELLGGNITASNVDLSGKISASSGQIGNFNIIANKISGSNITLDADSSRIFKSDENGETDGYYIDFTPGTNFYVRFGTDFAVSSSGQLIASGAKIEGVLTSSAGKIANWTIEPNRLVGGNVRLDSGGQIGVGSIVDTSTVATTNAGFVADNNGNVLIKADDNNTNYLKFDVDGGTSALEIKTSAFELVGGNLTISGTVSSSVGNIGGFTINGTQISSSNASGETGLILKSDGQITASNAKIVGDVTATSGKFTGDVSATSIQATTGSIGGFLITNSEISSSGASGDTGLRLKSSGEITASKAKVTGDIVANTITANTSGQIGGFDIGSNIISASSGNLILKSSGQITASAVSMSGTINASGGIIGGFTIGDDLQNSAGATLQLDGAVGQITASAALINGNSVIAGFNITNDKISSQVGTLVLSSSGQITGSKVLFSGGKITGDVSIEGGLEIGALPEFPSNENLIAHWDFNGFTSGSSVDSNDFILDNSGNNLSGSVANTFQIAGGVAGNAVLLQSESLGAIIWDYDELDSLNHESNFTMTIWAKRFHPNTGSADPNNTVDQTAHPGVFTDGQPIFLKGSTSDSFGIDYRFGSNQVRCGMRSGSLTRQVNFTMDDDLLNFHHLAFTFESGSDTGIKLYVDGVERGSTTSKGLDGLVFPSADHIKVGGSGVIGGNGGPFNGFLDEPRVYSKTLSANEVRALYLNPEGIGATLISGDQITTGRIKSNNLSTTEGSEFNLNDGTFKLGGTSNPDLQFDGTTLQVSGTLSSSVGNIGGFTLDTSEIKSNNASGDTGLRLKANGEITASAAKITGNITSTAGTIGGFTLGANKLSSNNLVLSSSTGTDFIISASNFNVKADGQVTASNISMSGVITATKLVASQEGEIGGFTIDSTDIRTPYDSNGGFGLEKDNRRMTFRTGSEADSVVLTIGNLGDNKIGIKALDSSDSSKTLFKLGEDGNQIGGFTLSNQRLTGTKGLIIDSLSGSIFLSSNTSTDGTTIDGAEGIFGHGDDNSKRYTSHAGQFRFTEDSISPPPNSDGIVYSEAEPDSVDSYNGNFNQPVQGGGTT